VVVAHALYPADEAAARAWITRCCTSYATAAKGTCSKLAGLAGVVRAAGTLVDPANAKEINYFEQHREHLHYAARAAEGCPVGSGRWNPVRATARPFQTVRTVLDGAGRQRLMALEVARRNQDWNEVWKLN